MRSLGFVVVAGVLLAGCSAGGGVAAPSEGAGVSASPGMGAGPGPITPTPTPVPGTTVVPREPLRVTGEMTKPGTRLRIGEKAIVPVRHYYPLYKTYAEGVLGIVVERIRTTPGSKIQGNFDEDSRKVLKRHVAYHAKVIITNEGGDPISPGTPRLGGDFGDFGPTVTVTGQMRLPGCREGYPPDSDAFGHKGAKWKTCVLAVSSRTTPMTGVVYDDAPYGKDVQFERDPAPDFNEHYELGAITWS